MPSPEEILSALRSVQYPGFNRDIVSIGVIKDVEIASEGVTVIMTPTTRDTLVIESIRASIENRVGQMNVGRVTVRLEKPAQLAQTEPRGPRPIPGVRHTIAVASGKGGVGKSTIAVNLAVALSQRLERVGLMDADVYGPSIPMMLGIREQRPGSTENKRILPVPAHGLAVISMGFFVAERTPVIWRGPMLTRILTEFVRDVEWGDLDCLVLDLPPGTGDAQLTIAQQVRLAGGVIVTTPQDVALLDVKRAITMFDEIKAPVLGVVENMSYHVCPSCQKRAEIFGHGGGARMARQMGVPFLGEIPLYRAVRSSGDNGRPIVTAEPEHPAARAIQDIAERVAERLSDPASAS
jgi:ATP-binding protein involved in chromosome partitioning